MDVSHLAPFSAAGSRVRQVQDAKDMQQVIIDRVTRSGGIVPPYEFIELIGKGSFGRVYRCRHKESRDIVAVKIIDVDSLDYTLDNKQKDEAIEDFVKEVNALKQVKDSKAMNINHIREAFDLHSQLWIVSDYCSGGSVHTLMKTLEGNGLEETYLVPIARELAIALKHVHEAGVMHRDIKCGNVLISEDGHVQLCDFGVAAKMEDEVSKRSTIIGTPYWMAPEMLGETTEAYGFEIDCWAYGCTVYELATGAPPNSKFHPQYLPAVLKQAPRLDEDKYSAPLCDFVAFCLQDKPEDRPNAKEIVNHPYIANTESRFPTTSLRTLIDRFMRWEHHGGQRHSLFNPMGAAAPQLEEVKEERAAWRFSTTEGFDLDYQRQYGGPLTNTDTFDFAGNGPIPLVPSPDKIAHITPFEKAKQEAAAKRGERSLDRLFDPSSDPYDYDTTIDADNGDQPLSDLPLRNMSGERAANRETLIDLDTSGLEMPTFNFDFSDIATVKGNRKSSIELAEDDGSVFYSPQDQDTRRATVDWKFPGFAAEPEPDPEPEQDNSGTMKKGPGEWNDASGFLSSQSDKAADAEEIRRRTMEWSFTNAGPASVDPDDEADIFKPNADEDTGKAPGFRPHLTRTATEPIGQFNDFLHPPAGSLDAAKVVNRESTPMIDLDFADDLQSPNPPSLSLEGPSPPGELVEDPIIRTSSPLSYTHSLTSIGPFDLEPDPDRREDDLRRYSTRRVDRSLPAPSVAERRASRYLHANHSSSSVGRNRGASFDSTASSNPEDTEDYHGREYQRSMNQKMREQLRAGLERSFSKTHVRQLTGDSYGDTDTGSEAYAQEPGAYDTDSSMPEERLTIRPSRGFPEPQQPSFNALLEGASQEDLYQQMDNMFAAMEAGLGYTAAVLRRREADLGPGDIRESMPHAAAAGVTSEEERELAGFS